jgi:hypothetical protein
VSHPGDTGGVSRHRLQTPPHRPSPLPLLPPAFATAAAGPAAKCGRGVPLSFGGACGIADTTGTRRPARRSTDAGAVVLCDGDTAGEVSRAMATACASVVVAGRGARRIAGDWPSSQGSGRPWWLWLLFGHGSAVVVYRAGGDRRRRGVVLAVQGSQGSGPGHFCSVVGGRVVSRHVVVGLHLRRWWVVCGRIEARACAALGWCGGASSESFALILSVPAAVAHLRRLPSWRRWAWSSINALVLGLGSSGEIPSSGFPGGRRRRLCRDLP